MSIVIVDRHKPREIELKNFMRGDTFAYMDDLFIVSTVHATERRVDCVFIGGPKSGALVTFPENLKVNEIAIKMSCEYI